jgi:NADPH:quinone reductase-like Zn-dependent oxidoreductase
VKIKAIVCVKPGPVAGLAVSEIASPAVPDDGVLVRVRDSSANPVDLFPTSRIGNLVNSKQRALALGTDFAGTVEAVGRDVTEFRAGDEVFGGARGAFAELMCVREKSAIVGKPVGVTSEQAGTVAVAATTALQALRTHGRLEAGQRVLVNGASGGVGTFAVQIACALGAEVTAVCSTRNLDMVRSLGARTVVDYTREDFTRGDQRYDLIVDIAGSHSLRECRRVMTPRGTFVGVGAAGVQHGRGGGWRAIGHFLGTRVGSMGRSQRVVVLFIARLNKDDLTFLGELIASGKVTPVIERRFKLGEVGAALSYLNEGHARAKVAISVASP